MTAPVLAASMAMPRREAIRPERRAATLLIGAAVLAASATAHLAAFLAVAQREGDAGASGRGGGGGAVVIAASDDIAALVDRWDATPEVAAAAALQPQRQAPAASATAPSPLAETTSRAMFALSPPPARPGLQINVASDRFERAAQAPRKDAAPSPPAQAKTKAPAEASTTPLPAPTLTDAMRPEAPAAAPSPLPRPALARPESARRQPPVAAPAIAPSEGRTEAAETSARSGAGAAQGKAEAAKDDDGAGRGAQAGGRGDGAAADLTRRWGAAITARIKAQLRPGPGPVRRPVLLRIEVGRNGTLRASEVIRSSGVGAADRLALSAARRATLPPAPAALTGAWFAFDIPVRFR